MNFGFYRVAAGVPNMRVADTEFNVERILGLIDRLEAEDARFIIFPELCLTGYSCGDLFHQHTLIHGAEAALVEILKRSVTARAVIMVGLPVQHDNQLFNCAAVMQGGELLGIVPKTYLPGYKEFYEERWFAPGPNALNTEISIDGRTVPFGTDLLFRDSMNSRLCFGVEICEDLWATIPPSTYQAQHGALIHFNLSASNEFIGKSEYRKELVTHQSAKCSSAYVYVSSGIDESTTDVVYGGHGMVAEYGQIIAETERFQLDEQVMIADIDVEKLLNDRLKTTPFMENLPERRFRQISFTAEPLRLDRLRRHIPAYPFVPGDDRVRDERCREIFAIQTCGLGKRVRHTGAGRLVLGVSGGLDSTLALLVAARTMDSLGIPRDQVISVTMPGFGTTDQTYQNALDLMQSMGVSIMEIPIRDSVLQHFRDIGQDPEKHDVTYENAQARERTQILMDLANKTGGMVIGTGDLSELALGFATYNGDHMSMYGVNAGIPKTLIRYLIRWVADNAVQGSTRDVLYRILETPISPELIPPDQSGRIVQRTEEIIGPYALHDFFLYHLVRYGAPPRKILFLARQAFEGEFDEDEIRKWLLVFLQRFFRQQFKRSCLPDGPKVGTISLSPRGDWRMPSDASVAGWLTDLVQEEKEAGT